MDNTPLVSVIIPTYNRENMVGNAIKSVLAQTYSNFELIVVDDGSTDNTKTLIEGNFPEARYIAKPNGGQASARNKGLEHANGKYIASLDSDDLWGKAFLSSMVSALEKNHLDFVFSNWNQQQNNGDYVDYLAQYVYLPSHLPKDGNAWVPLGYEDLRKIYLAGCPSPSSSLLIRASVLKKMGWNENMNIADDWCMLLDIIINNKTKAAYTTERLWKKHIDCDNIYDGRNQLEVLKLFHIEDKSAILERYRPLLTAKEIKDLEKEYILNLMIISKETLFINKDFKKSLSYMVKAFSEHPKSSFRLFFQVITKKLKNKNLKKSDIV
tara:strand:- start:7102 stop:8076 length:975 start_codon:yes stop_codon:yes gene_type:complete